MTHDRLPGVLIRSVFNLRILRELVLSPFVSVIAYETRITIENFALEALVENVNANPLWRV